MNKQKLALFIVLIILILAVIWSFISAPRQKTVSTAKSAPGQTEAAVRATKAVVPVVTAETAAKPAAKSPLSSDDRTLRLDLLELEQSGFKGYRRNIFKPIFTDEIKLMKQKSAAFKPVPVPPVAVVAQVPVPLPPPFEPDTHQTILSRFIFLGYLKKDNRKTIFLSKDKEIILVRKGETFAKRYEAKVITEQALTIRVTDTGEEIVIPLTENKPLAAAAKK
jgi:Na+-transporting methylmalonyl-CoA/oxaloacetate decarboxylase gamma subunit